MNQTWPKHNRTAPVEGFYCEGAAGSLATGHWSACDLTLEICLPAFCYQISLKHYSFTTADKNLQTTNKQTNKQITATSGSAGATEPQISAGFFPSVQTPRLRNRLAITSSTSQKLHVTIKVWPIEGGEICRERQVFEILYTTLLQTADI